jgi:hypothetical protein
VRKPPVIKDRCLILETFAATMSNMKKILRTSEGSSIIVRRLDCAEAEDEECNRRKSAACAINCEKIQGLTLHASQPSAVNFDVRITLQPKIAARGLCKSRSISVDPDLPRRLVKALLQGSNHIEIILNLI